MDPVFEPEADDDMAEMDKAEKNKISTATAPSPRCRSTCAPSCLGDLECRAG